MSHDKEKRQLEQLWGIEKELNDKKKRGDISYLDYLVKAQHIRKTFGEQSPRAAHALALAEELLHWSIPPEQQVAREKLIDASVHEYGLWLAEYKEKCVGPLSMKILEGLQGIEAPPIPEPSPEAIKRAGRAYNHRLGRDAAKVPNFAVREITHQRDVHASEVEVDPFLAAAKGRDKSLFVKLP
jgi:hypothetical protein